jgi:hypothetical protein
MGMPRTGRLARWQLFCVFACVFLAASGIISTPSASAEDESPIEFLLKQKKLDRQKGRNGYFPSSRRTTRSRLYFGFLPGIEEVPRDGGRDTISIVRPNINLDRQRRSKRVITLEPGDAEQAASSGSVSYCVRLCDGFFFPIGDAGGNTSAHETACQAQCPTAETRLFTAPAGSDGIEEATSGGQRYTSIANAFRYRDRFDKACTCNARGQGVTSLAYMNDFTMKPGDVVMTNDGLKVLSGTRRFPFKDANFVPATWSKKLSAKERDGLKRLEDGGRTQAGRKVSEKELKTVESLFRDPQIENVTSGSETRVNDPQQLIRYLGAQDTDAGPDPLMDTEADMSGEQAAVSDLPDAASALR